MARTTWTRHLTVDKRIVKLLSASTYEDFPGAIREMVSNAYDADATEVKIEINIEDDLISIIDNGNGMTPEQFDFFLRIAGQQRGRNISPEFGRERIGQFGIGFLAIFQFGKRIQITSTASRSEVLFEATIPADQFTKEGRFIDVEAIPIPGFETHEHKYLNRHGTSIEITGLTDMACRYFQNRDITIANSRHTIRGWPPNQRLEWALCEDLPIDYQVDSPYKDAFSDLKTSGFRVWLNGKELFRNSLGANLLENDTWEDGEIKCRYIIATDWKSITPSEARGLKQRLKNVGIGKRTSFDLGLYGRAYSRLHWMTGEIRILEGLDHLLGIDRSKFVDSLEYDRFSEYFRSRLAFYANLVESVSEAVRDIKRQLTDSRVAEVGARKEIINKNIQRLKSRGFEVVTKETSKSREKSEPVRIDIEKRIVEVIDNHPSFNDTFYAGPKQYPVRYLKWDPYSQELSAVRRALDGSIEINTNYPLFKSRRYGEIFKKILVMILTLSEEVDSPKSLLSRLSKHLLDEFGNL